MNEVKDEVLEPQYEEVPEVKKEVRTDSYFDGKLLELIGYRILGFLITIFTLGIASAWAEKFIIAYKIEHTVYNGKRLKFEGTGASLFVQRFKWVFLSIITLGIYSLWIPLKKENWIYSNTHFEDEDFIKGESYFDGKLLGLIGVNLLTKLLTIISFGLLYPFVICYKQKWLAKHTIINRKKLSFTGKTLSIIGNYLLWIFLTIITFGIFALWIPIKMWKWQTKNTHIKVKDEQEEKLSVIPAIIAIVVAVVIVCGIVSFIGTLNIEFYVEKFFDEGIDIEGLFDNSSNIMENAAVESVAAAPDEASMSSIKNTNNKANKKESQKTEKVNAGSSTTNTSNYSASDYHRDTKLTLVDAVLCYGSPNHDSDLVASIEGNGDIALSQYLGAVLIENANAKYLYKVSKIAADNVDLYFITKNNQLYVIKNPNASQYNQPTEKVTNSKVKEFLGTESKDDGDYLKVLLENGEVEYILYLSYPS